MSDTYRSFCTRMWLDHCDENKAPFSITYTEEEYVEKYKDWLLDKYSKQVEKDNESIKK